MNFNPQAGHEQAGFRPALVITPANYNKKSGLALFCPITSQKKGYPFEVEIPGGVGITGVILTDQIKSLDWRIRKTRPLGKLPSTPFALVLSHLGALIHPD